MTETKELEILSEEEAARALAITPEQENDAIAELDAIRNSAGRGKSEPLINEDGEPIGPPLVATIFFDRGFPIDFEDKRKLAINLARGLNKWNTNGGGYHLSWAVSDVLAARESTISFGAGHNYIRVGVRGVYDVKGIIQTFLDEVRLKDYIRSLDFSGLSETLEGCVEKMLEGKVRVEFDVKPVREDVQSRREIEARHGDNLLSYEVVDARPSGEVKKKPNDYERKSRMLRRVYDNRVARKELTQKQADREYKTALAGLLIGKAGKV